MRDAELAAPEADKRTARVDRASVLIYAALIAYVATVKLVFTFFPVQLQDAGQASDLTWGAIAIFAVLGAVGVVLLRPSGFPAAWDRRIPISRRIVLPLGIGLGAGLIFWLMNRLHPFGFPNVAFPMSLILYPLGAVLVEIQFRLFPAPLLMWLVGVVILRRRWPKVVFLCVALGLSLIEPLMQRSGFQPMPAIWSAALMTFIGLENLAEMFLFRAAGFLAPLAMRIGFYAIWHLLRTA
jgi:hypothetical protein